MMLADELLPCPFCGGTDLFVDRGSNIDNASYDHPIVSCDACLVECPLEHWNTRATELAEPVHVPRGKQPSPFDHWCYATIDERTGLPLLTTFLHGVADNDKARFEEGLSILEGAFNAGIAQGRALERAEIVAWQPIETAPEDEPVLVWSPDDYEPGSMVGILSTFLNTDGDVVGEEWVGFCSDRDIEPTHWMPLPLPPSIEAGQHEEDGE